MFYIFQIRLTESGYLEERLPFLSITLPKKFRRLQPSVMKNLRANKRRLATPFDLHSSLLDILNFSGRMQFPLRTNSSSLKKNMARGLSLFKELPLHRTCTDAGIPDQYCTCYRTTPLDLGEPLVSHLANELIKHVNVQLHSQAPGMCAHLSLSEVRYAVEVHKHLSFSNSSESTILNSTLRKTLEMQRHFRLQLVTSPNKAILEGTLSLDATTISLKAAGDATSSLKVSGDISRLNMYGQQSRCVDDVHLKKYCYCTSA